MVLTNHKALSGLEQKPLNPYMIDRERRAMVDILRFNVKVVHIPKGQNLLVDYMSRTKHHTKEAPHYARHAPSQAMMAVIHKGTMLDVKLIPFIELANQDQHYQTTIQALEDGDSPGTLHPNHPANRYNKVWKSLQVYKGPNGSLMMYKQGRVVIPDNDIENTLEQLHQHHASVSEMT